MKLQFTTRDLLWLIALLAVALAGWLNYRHMNQQLTDCKAALARVAEQLEQVDSDSNDQITSLRRDLFNAQHAAASAKREAAINAERPLPIPGQEYTVLTKNC